MTKGLTPDQEHTAIEDTQKWLLEAVVGLNLCPFAKAVVVKDMVCYRVCHPPNPPMCWPCCAKSCNTWPRPTQTS